jgi:hypothetical protein
LEKARPDPRRANSRADVQVPGKCELLGLAPVVLGLAQD